MPGMGTTKQPSHLYFNSVIVVIRDGRPTETDNTLLQEIKRHSIPFYIVQNKFQRTCEDEGILVSLITDKVIEPSSEEEKEQKEKEKKKEINKVNNLMGQIKKGCVEAFRRAGLSCFAEGNRLQDNMIADALDMYPGLLTYLSHLV
eukprot:Pgem_evm2s3093